MNRRHEFASLIVIAAVAASGCHPEAARQEPPAEAPRDTVKGLAYFLGWLTDLDRLALPDEGVEVRQFSSYDRNSRYDETTGQYFDWEANGDSGQYLRKDPATGEGVMAEIDGPGCIWRIWSANPQGSIRFYFDGAKTPSLELDFKEMFQGKGFPFPRPLLWQRSFDLGGDNPASDSYVPIPFAKSCRVTADKPHGQYYHIGYSTFPKGWRVKTFSLPLSAGESAAAERAAKLLSKCGEDPQEAPQGCITTAQTTTLEPGKPVELFLCDEGPGVIRAFKAKLESKERWARRKVLLQIYWDGEEQPAVDAPIGDFFGDAWQGAPYRSLPLGITEDLDYCYFRMPYGSVVRIVVTNAGTEQGTLRYSIVHEHRGLAPDAFRFHARWRRDRNSGDFDYRILDASGAGRFVGVALFPDNLVGGWWGEGDEKVFVDGENFPSTFGTGSEDYFGDAWGIRYFSNAFHGCPTPISHEAGRRQSCYRWHISDSIPFRRSIRMTIENYAALLAQPVRNDYSSVTYWYQLPDGTDSFGVADAKGRVPQGHVVPGAIDAEAIAASPLPPGVTVVADGALPRELSGGKGLRLAGRPGTAVSLRLPSAVEGDFTIEVAVARGVPTSPIGVFQGGQRIGYKVHLKKGENDIELRLVESPVGATQASAEASAGGAKAPAGAAEATAAPSSAAPSAPAQGAPAAAEPSAIVDYILLHPYRNFVRNWYLIGPFPNKGDAGLDEAFGPEAEPFQKDKAYTGKSGEVRWRRIVVPSGVFDGSGLFDDGENLVAYAYCEITSPTDRQVTGLLGSDDGVKVWVNEKVVHSRHSHRVVTPDEDRFEIPLRQGGNTVLLKVDQGGGPWGFAFRIDDPAEELKYAIPE